MTDPEFDAYLVSRLDEAGLPDGDFTTALVARLARRRRFRALAFGGAVAAASLIAAVLASLSGGPVVSVPAVTPQAMVATLLLAAVCSLVWIATESGPATSNFIRTRSGP